MSYYLKKGKSYIVTSKESLDLHEQLPVGNFTVQFNSDTGFYLEEIERFSDVKRYYGDILRNAERIYTTFMDRAQSTGVIFNGEKGSGKSLLAKALSIRGYADGIPTIVINAAFHGDNFNKFVQSIQQPTIILFDEFEKVYDREEQEGILTLLDGVYPSKKLFVLTCNDKWRVDFNMRNRPGRIFYMLDFRGLEQAFVREYCEENLKNKAFLEKTCNIVAMFTEFNFDMLKALVEEMNRYNEDPSVAIRLLNIKPEYDSQCSFDVELFVNKKPVEISKGDESWDGNPLNSNFSISYKVVNASSNDVDDCYWVDAYFDSSNIVRVDASRGAYTLKNENGEVVTLTRIKAKNFNYLDVF
jgi:hypothetical protein